MSLHPGISRYTKKHTGCPKKIVLIECCWSHGAQAQSPVAGTTWALKVFFWSFLTKTKQDQVPQTQVHGTIYPATTQFWLWFCFIGTFFWTPCIMYKGGVISDLL